MPYKPCEMCAVFEVCAHSLSETIPCPIENATENDTIKINYEEE